MERMKVGGVLVTEKVGMISVLGAASAPGVAGTVLDSLGQRKINVEFISCCPDIGDGYSISVCVEMDLFEKALEAIEDVRETVQAKQIETNPDLCVVAVFGPHFREIPNIASQIFKAHAAAGINILAISTSISSVSCVFDQSRLSEALDSLRKHFEIP
jgi:aspartokinase